MIAPTVRPDPVVIWNLAAGLALLMYATDRGPWPQRWALTILAGALLGLGVHAALEP